MGADLARARAGKRTQTGMSAQQLEEFARGPVTGQRTKQAKQTTAKQTKKETH